MHIKRKTRLGDFIKLWIMAVSSIFNFFMPTTVAIDSKCDYYQRLVMGQEYYFFNKEYPDNYLGQRNCTWLGESIKGSKIVISCEYVSLPESTNCNGDKLRISLSGIPEFSDSNKYCGVGSVTLITKENLIAIGFSSTSSNSASRFLCTLTAVIDSQVGAANPPRPVCRCGWLKAEPAISGGVETNKNEFPFMAGLVDVDRIDVYCGASIISERYILSAAHCVIERSPSKISVLVGDHDLTSGNDTTDVALYQITGFEYHPQYNATSQINDIAILKTSQDITFGNAVGPVCLPFRYTYVDFEGESVTTLGWGQTEFTGPKSDVLQKVSLRVTSISYCTDSHPTMIVNYNQICTYAPGKDACQSDSGGPIFRNHHGKTGYLLIGIISYGLGCASFKPAVNTRVTSYIPWIVSKTSDASYCIM